MPNPLLPGTRLGPYEIREPLGSGALGVVFRAIQESLGREVAIKVLSPALAVDPELVERFRREARTAAALRHPHIVTIYDTGTVDGIHFIAMELLPGETLEKLPLPIDSARSVHIVRQLADALSYAHQHGVVHRDLKPENAIIDSAGQVTLTDFGIARVAGQAKLTLGGGPVGTPEFMSPEQARGEDAGPESDVYSLGLLLYFLLTGASPFRAGSLLATMYRQIHDPLPAPSIPIPSPLLAWIERCTEKDAGARFASGRESLAALDEAAAALNPSAASSSSMTPASVSAMPSDLPQRTRPLAQTMDAILRGEIILADAINPGNEDVLRRAFREEVTVLSAEVTPAGGSGGVSDTSGEEWRRSITRVLASAMVCSWDGSRLTALFASADEGVSAARLLADSEDLSTSTISEQRQEGERERAERDCLRTSTKTGQQSGIRIGLNTGRVLMSNHQRLGQVASPVLYVVERLRKAAPLNGILLSFDTWRSLAEPESWKCWGRIPDVGCFVYGSGDSSMALVPASEAHLRPSSAETLAHNSVRSLPVDPHALQAYSDAKDPVLPGTWLLLTMGATGSWYAGPQAGNLITLLLWIFSAIAAGACHRKHTPLSGLAIFISLAGIILNLVIPLSTVEFALVTLGLVSTIAFYANAIGSEDAIRKNDPLPAGMMLTIDDLGQPQLSAHTRGLLHNDVEMMSRRFGIDANRVAAQVQVVNEGPRLTLSGRLCDRETSRVLAACEVQGDSISATALARDLTRKMALAWEAEAISEE